MVVELSLRPIGEDDIARAEADESSLEPFLQPELPRELIARKLAKSPNLPAEIRARYTALLAEPPEGVVVEPALGLHKAWHGIHYLLTGERAGGAPPLAWAVLGDPAQTIGADEGHGPASFLRPPQVERVASALSNLDGGELSKRYDARAMVELEIEPLSMWLREADDGCEWLLQFYQPLCEHYARAAERGRAMLIWMS